MRIIRKIKCWMGFHSYYPVKKSAYGSIGYKFLCIQCGGRRERII